MKNPWLRAGTFAVALTAILAGASALATPSLERKDTKKCGYLKSRYCATTCEDSVYSNGLCVDDRTGQTSAVSVQCCCCTPGANHRSFIGG